jgi:GntR family transcriptional regulator
MDSPLRKERRSLVLQLRDQIRSLLKEKFYRAGDQLPSEESLVGMFGVSRATVREALKLLEEEKLIIVQHGRGRFLAVDSSSSLTEDITRLESVTEMAGLLGIQIETEVLDMRREPANEVLQARLNLQPGEMVYILERARKNAGETVIFSVDIFPARIVSGEIQKESFQGSLLALMEGEWGERLAYSRAVISAEGLDEAISERIPECRTSNWILMEQVNYDERDTPVLYSRDYHRSDKFHFHVLRRRR